MPDEDKTFSSFLVLDLRIWWCQAHTIAHSIWVMITVVSEKVSAWVI